MSGFKHRIITSRCDQDSYKFSMAQAVFHNYTNMNVRYEFTCRSKGIDLSQYIPFIKDEIEKMKDLRFSKKEIKDIRNKLPFLKEDFLQYLYNSVLNPNFVKIYKSNNQGGIDIVIEGPWIDTIWFEVPILAIISEVYTFDKLYKLGSNEEEVKEIARKKLSDKIDSACEKYNLEYFPKFVDFGTRRRATASIQRELLTFLKDNPNKSCIGTSNVLLGIDLDMKVTGTMAHEWIMAHAAITRFDLSQKMALDVWQKEYRDQLGIALSDTYTTDFFLKDFDGLFAKSFSGIRQDSGNPIEVGYKFIKHYESLGIDPMTKQIIFSDSLDFDKIAMLHKEFKGKINAGFGIGTNLSNDIGIDPLSIVIKLSYAQYGNNIWYPMIKLSDVNGKTMCKDSEYAEFIKKIVRGR